MSTMGEVFPHLWKPQTVLPSLTNRGVIHQAVETVGLLPGGSYLSTPAMYVNTRCGLRNFGPCEPHQRGQFPDCKRCFPPGREP